MAFSDYWELSDPSDTRKIWTLMTGRPEEDSVDTSYQASVILEGIPHGARVLEVGAGIGRLLRRIVTTGNFLEHIGVDSSISIALVSKDYLGNHAYSSTRGMVIMTDGVHLPFPDYHFDFAYSFTCFQHMISLAIIHRNLSEIRRVLVPGGICRIQTVVAGDLDPRGLKDFDGRVFQTADDFAAEFRNVGLDVTDIKVGLTHPSHVWVTARK